MAIDDRCSIDLWREYSDCSVWDIVVIDKDTSLLGVILASMLALATGLAIGAAVRVVSKWDSDRNVGMKYAGAECYRDHISSIRKCYQACDTLPGSY